MAVRERGYRETFRRLASFFTEERLAQLDCLLVRAEWLGRTPLAWLGERAGANTSKAMIAELKKLDFLYRLDVAGWDLSTINHNRLKFLARPRLRPARFKVSRSRWEQRRLRKAASLWRDREMVKGVGNSPAQREQAGLWIFHSRVNLQVA
jgi:hypothetical protein